MVICCYATPLDLITIIDLIMNIKQFFVNKEDSLVSSHKGCIKGGRVCIEKSFLVGLAETLPLPFFFLSKEGRLHGGQFLCTG